MSFTLRALPATECESRAPVSLTRCCTGYELPILAHRLILRPETRVKRVPVPTAL